jgi:catechol 2,3-dioxygenase-like lactoylglutathione lyase family enzyme
MKRFHVHVAVDDLAKSIDFYSKLFGQAPTKEKADYAKWMLEDPRVNFAISARGQATGVDHFGFQVDNAEELQALKKFAEAASGEKVLEQNDTTCCYANSEKHWTIDPQGLAWEHFHTLSEAKHFGSDAVENANACCAPISAVGVESVQVMKNSCAPKSVKAGAKSCC